jgi:Glycosyltransferase like family 2
MPANETASLDRLGIELRRLRGDPAAPPDASVVIPVNAQEDLKNVLGILGDVARYEGMATLEVILVINNYPEADPPRELETYARAGVRTVGVPDVRRPGEVVSFTARLPGTGAARSDLTIHFDADCRVPNASALLTWYIKRLRGGAQAAYSPVEYYDLRSLWSVRARIAVHHAARWAKRVLMRIPTVRGSNYAVDRALFLRLYDEGKLIDDLNVGLAVKASGGSLAYSRDRELRVLTSGRRFKGGWLKLARYLLYRMRYNLRMIRSSKGGAEKPSAKYDRTLSR